MDRIYDQGDIIYLDCSPHAGHEQAGRRPGLVVSTREYYSHTRLIIICPITRTNKEYPLHVKLDRGYKITGVVMCEQLRSIDPIARNVEFIERAPQLLIHDVLTRIAIFFKQ